MNVVVDTSIWIDFFKGKPLPELDEALRGGIVYLTPVIAAELISGVSSKLEETELFEFLHHLPVVDCPFLHWIAVGKLRGKCRKLGLTVSTPDAHIAQAALDIHGTLFTKDQIFAKIAQHIGLKSNTHFRE